MTTFDKLREVGKKFNLNTTVRTGSHYGNYNGMNVRVSDHMPKFNNLQQALDTVTTNVHLFVVITNEQIDTEEWMDEAAEWYNDMMEVEDSEVYLEVFREDESIEVILSNLSKY